MSERTYPEISANVAGEYDHILLIDQSGSMGEPSTKFAGKNRWQELQETALAYARFIEKVDADGIDIILFNSQVKKFENSNGDQVKSLFENNWPSGTTNLAGALKAAFDKKFSTGKKTIVMAFTDGIPDSEADVKRIIEDAANKIEKDEDLAVQFVQIGDDRAASAYLQSLDDKLNTKFDIVNTLTREEAEQLSPLQLIYQALND